jgi:hypothetical protein
MHGIYRKLRTYATRVATRRSGDSTVEQLALSCRHRDIRTRAVGLVLRTISVRAPGVIARLGVSVQSPQLAAGDGRPCSFWITLASVTALMKQGDNAG